MDYQTKPMVGWRDCVGFTILKRCGATALVGVKDEGEAVRFLGCASRPEAVLGNAIGVNWKCCNREVLLSFPARS